jgi:hypothetical protein
VQNNFLLFKDRYHYLASRYLVSIICFIMISFSIIIRTPKIDKYIFHNADALYHVLLTMQAFEETPSSVHNFLPIVTLGNSEDKGIKWGGTIPDQSGNYYYTSFSPAGFLAPYLFTKLFHLPINIKSLYLFNSLLYILCFIGTARLFGSMFIDEQNKNTTILVVAFIYLFQPEIMHSQGIVYWHQSLYQLLFIFQLYLFFNLKNKRRLLTFFLLCLIGPYVEWTGYISNIGFAIAFLFSGNKKFNKSASLKFLTVGILTVSSLVLHLMHFLSVMPWNVFFVSVYNRFICRSLGAGESVFICFAKLMKSFFISYGVMISIITIALIYILSIKVLRLDLLRTLKKYRVLGFILCFVMLENLLLRQHATVYSFDRIKAVLLLIFITLCIFSVLKNYFNNKLANLIVMSSLAVAAMVNVGYYMQNNNYYKREVDYLKNNRSIAKSINDRYSYENSILAHEEIPTRGYSNVLFQRGIYENTSLDSARKIALSDNKQYVVLFKCTYNSCNLYDYSNYIVYDVINECYIE